MVAISPTEYETRIKALERQCATLSAQVDRQAKVIDIVEGYVHQDRKLPLGLVDAFFSYQREMAQLAKEERGRIPA